MKVFLFSVFCLLFSVSANAQDSTALWLPEVPPANVEVVEHGDAGQTIASLRAASQQGRVRGYRVRIFFDNGQSARSQAAGALAQFRELFPSTAGYMTYENPYFKVSVGNCTSIEEAVMLRARISGAFPKAFITSEAIPLTVLAE